MLYRNLKTDAYLNTYFFKISGVAHSIIYNTLIEKKLGHIRNMTKYLNCVETHQKCCGFPYIVILA